MGFLASSRGTSRACYPRFDGGLSPLVRLLLHQHTVDRWRGAPGSMGLLLRLITEGSASASRDETLDAMAGSPSPAYGSTRASVDVACSDVS